MQPPSTQVASPDNPPVDGDAVGPERHASLTRQLVAALIVLLSAAWQVAEAPGVSTVLRFLHQTGHETGQTWLPTLGSWGVVLAACVAAALVARRRVPLLVGLTATVVAAAVLNLTQPVAGSGAASIGLAIGVALTLCLPRLAPRWQAVRWALVLLCWPAVGLLDLGLEPGPGQVLAALALAGLAGLLPALAQQLARRPPTLA